MALAADNETFLIGPAQVAPKLVCVSVSAAYGHADVIHAKDPACKKLVFELMESDEVIVGANTPFDVGVWVNEWPELMARAFERFELGLFADVQTRQKLLDIARGMLGGYRHGLTGAWIEYKYNLAALAKRFKYPENLDKDTWRLRYSELYDTPVEEWPEGAVEYSRHDAMSTLWVYELQEEEPESFLGNQVAQCKAHWALHLTQAWGLRTDPDMVEMLRWMTEQQLEDYKELLLKHDPPLLELNKKTGAYVKKNKRAQELATALWEERGGIPRGAKTKTGNVSVGEDGAKLLGDPVILAFQQFSSASTVVNRVEELEAGTLLPIHTRFEVLKVSGRTSSSNPNVQNRTTDPMKRPTCHHNVHKGKWVCPVCGAPYIVAGDRESFVPRLGFVFLICDVPGLELRTIAQTAIIIVGYSHLAEVLNEGRDPHLEVAATLLNISSEEAYERKKNLEEDSELYLARQTGKITNFGLNARLGWRGMIQQARSKYGIVLTEQQAKDGIEAYYTKWTEQEEFHKWVDAQCGQTGSMHVVHPFSERHQGLVRPTVASNTYSQGLGADSTKAALYSLVRACYVGDDVLRGSRVVNFIHDEYIIETEESELDAKSDAVGRVICEAANRYLPDVPIPLEEMKPYAARRWSKMARKVTNPDGTLGVWEWAEWEKQCAS